MYTVTQLDDHDVGFGLGAAADREGAGDRPTFGRDTQGRRAGGVHVSIHSSLGIVKPVRA
jgi:hypothetical protein